MNNYFIFIYPQGQILIGGDAVCLVILFKIDEYIFYKNKC